MDDSVRIRAVAHSGALQAGKYAAGAGACFALLLTLVICCAAGWDIDDPKDVHRSLYLASVIMMGLLTFVYVYVPVWLAHLFMSFIEKRRARKN